MVNIAIVERQATIRNVLSSELEKDSDICLIGCAENMASVISICNKSKLDVVLIDGNSNRYNFIEIIKYLRNFNPSIRFICFFGKENEDEIMKAYSYGVEGYIFEDVETVSLIKIINCINEGYIVIESKIRDMLHKAYGFSYTVKLDKIDVMNNMYDRYGLDIIDRKVIKLIVDGKNNKEIAEILKYAEGTVKNRVSRIINITGLKDRTQIAVFALKNNLV